MIEILEKLVLEPIGKLSNSISTEVLQFASNKILEYTIKEYNRNFITKTFLHRAYPVNLLDIYQPLALTPDFNREKSISTKSFKLLIREFEKIENERIEKLKKEEAKKIKAEKQKSLKEEITRKEHLTIIGKAGSGKTTLIKYLFINIIKENLGIPIKVELRNLNDFEGSLFDYINLKIFKFHDLSIEERFTERLLKTGDFIIFLDGFDEVHSTKREKIIKEIDGFSAKYGKNKFLLTSRPYVKIDSLPQFSSYYIKDLEFSEIESFVVKQLPSEQKKLIEDILNSLSENKNSKYALFLSNPLLLSMFILTYQSFSYLPEKKSTFYSNVFETLFYLHDSLSKMLYERPKLSQLSKEEFQKVLSTLSFITHFEQKYNFQILYLEEKLTQIKQRNTNLSFNSDDLIEDLLVAVPLFVKEGMKYSFAHRSMQEYFTAKYIASILDKRMKYKFYKKLFNHLTDESKYVTEFYNLYELLEEIDRIDLYRFLVLPYLKLLLNKGLTSQEEFEKLFEKRHNLIKIIFDFQEIFKLWRYEGGNSRNKFGIDIIIEGESNLVQSNFLVDLITDKITQIEKEIKDEVDNEQFVIDVLNNESNND